MTNKFYGALGFTHTNEVESAVWEKSSIERNYYGEFIRNYRRWDQGEKVNADLKFERTLSVVADSYLLDEFFALTYVVDGGRKWSITKLELAMPRIILTLGDEYIEEDNNDRTEGGQSPFIGPSEGVCG